MIIVVNCNNARTAPFVFDLPNLSICHSTVSFVLSFIGSVTAKGLGLGEVALTVGVDYTLV